VKRLEGTSWRCDEVLPRGHRAGDARTPGPMLLTPVSTGLPPELIDRLRAAAFELGLPQSVIAAVAIALFLEGEGF
jgi:hypothetical protein